MKKLFLVSILFLASQINAAISTSDEVACENQKTQLDSQLSMGYAIEVEKVLKEVLMKSYQDMNIPVTESQIETAEPVSTFSTDAFGDDTLVTEISAKVNAGSDSIIAHAQSGIIITRSANRIETADRLGRVTSTRLVCSIEVYDYDISIYNSATKILIETVSSGQNLDFSIELP